jgi:drug/metabolite transporter (DMT)-like permease
LVRVGRRFKLGADASPHSGRARADLALLGTAVIWGSAFAAQRVAAAHLGPFVYNGFRFTLGAFALLPLVWRRLRGISRLEWGGGILAGLILVGAATLQQAGLRYTAAGRAAFITGLYVVLVPLFLALGWRQWPRRASWVASGLAVVGLFLLSGGAGITLSVGDALELAGAGLWALHVILIGHLAKRVDSLRLALIQYLTCGLVSTALGLALEWHTLSGLPAAWWAVVYGGVVSVGLGYTLQVVGQKGAPANDAAIMLSLEVVFAALFGWLLLGETLTPRQLLGCGLMLGGMLLAQFPADQLPAKRWRSANRLSADQLSAGQAPATQEPAGAWPAGNRDLV